MPGRVSAERLRQVLQRWQTLGLVERRRFLAGEAAWLWLTRRGLEQLGVPFKYTEPTLSSLLHRADLNQVRLWIEDRHPGAAWCGERALRAAQEAVPAGTEAAHLPDAEVQIGAQTIAVEVERTPKDQPRLVGILRELVACYHAVWYFTLPEVEPGLKRAKAQLAAPDQGKLFLMPLSEAVLPPNPRDQRARAG